MVVNIIAIYRSLIPDISKKRKLLLLPGIGMGVKVLSMNPFSGPYQYEDDTTVRII